MSRGSPSNANPRFNSPIPWLFDQRLSFAPTPVMYRAEFIRKAFVIAGLGGAIKWLMKYGRKSPQPPTTPGAEWLVPDEIVNNCWPTGKNKLVKVKPQTPLASKQASAVPFTPGLGACATPPLTCVP